MKHFTSACIAFVFVAQVHARHPDFLNTDFRKADSVAALYPKHSLANLSVLADKLTLPLSTEEEKFRAIYKWVSSNIEYDYALHVQNQQMREKLKSDEDRQAWNKKISVRVLKTLLTKQRTVCSGYAYLVKELSYHAGIICEVIDGYGRTPQSNIRGTGVVNHSWNAVQLHDKWYLCDPTWSSGAYDTQLREYIMTYKDEYFLSDPVLFIGNHYPLDLTWALLEKKPTLPEFLNAPLIYVGAFTYHITDLQPNTFDITVTRKEKVSFTFKSKHEWKSPKTELVVKGVIYPQTLQKNSDDTYSVDYVFTGRGTHIVHLLFDNNLAVTYTVTVK